MGYVARVDVGRGYAGPCQALSRSWGGCCFFCFACCAARFIATDGIRNVVAVVIHLFSCLFSLLVIEEE